MSAAELEAAMDTDEPEDALISYVMQAHTGGAPGAPAAAAGAEPEPEGLKDRSKKFSQYESRSRF